MCVCVCVCVCVYIYMGIALINNIQFSFLLLQLFVTVINKSKLTCVRRQVKQLWAHIE